jgi:ATP-binding cassette subfamily B (MDR/TAP) protein 1
MRFIFSSFQLRFSDETDRMLLALGVLGCFLYGTITPGQFILLGSLTQDIADYGICIRNNCSDPLDLEDSMTTVSILYIGLAAGNFFFSWLGIGLFGYSAERQVHKMRLALFRNVIHQEIGWFDKHSSGEILSRLSEYVILSFPRKCTPVHYFCAGGN